MRCVGSRVRVCRHRTVSRADGGPSPTTCARDRRIGDTLLLRRQSGLRDVAGHHPIHSMQNTRGSVFTDLRLLEFNRNALDTQPCLVLYSECWNGIPIYGIYQNLRNLFLARSLCVRPQSKKRVAQRQKARRAWQRTAAQVLKTARCSVEHHAQPLSVKSWHMFEAPAQLWLRARTGRALCSGADPERLRHSSHRSVSPARQCASPKR